MEENEKKETFGMKFKRFMVRNKMKFIIGGLITGGTVLGAGILGRHIHDDEDYIECIEEDYESTEYAGDPEDSEETSSEE